MAHPLASVDLNLLGKQLVACTTKWFIEERCFNPEDVLSSTGKSATEMAYDVLEKYISGDIDVKNPNATHADVFRVLRRSARNDFLDLVKPGRAYKRTEIYDETAGLDAEDAKTSSLRPLDDIISVEGSVFEELELHTVEQRVGEAIGNDPLLKRFVEAVLHGGCLKREDIAEYLGISHQDVTNCKRRLQERLATWRAKSMASSRGAK